TCVRWIGNLRSVNRSAPGRGPPTGTTRRSASLFSTYAALEKPRSRMKPSVTASIVGVLLTLAAARFVLFGGGQTRPAYLLGKVERGSIISTVRASGTLKPATSAVVSSQVVGQVNEVLVDVNEPVKAGQVLARLDSDSAQARLDTARADLEVARQGTEIARR